MSDNFVKVGGEPVATKEDLEELREEIQELRERVEELENE